MTNVEETVGPADLARAPSVGGRLRAIRRQQGLSLHDVTIRSRGKFKGSVLGAYERGDRVISVERLLRLADLYNVPAGHLLPPTDYNVEVADPSTEKAWEACTIDLVQLHHHDDTEANIIASYAATIQLRRQDFGNVLTIRYHDLAILAAVIGCSPEDLNRRLVDLGLRLSSRAATPPTTPS